MDMRGPRSRPLPFWAAALLLVAAVAAVYWPALRHGFVSYDDGLHIYDNPLVLHPGLLGLSLAWRGPLNDLYIPLTYSAWIGLGALGKGAPSPAFFHAASLFAHLGCGLLVLSLLRRLSGGAWAALAGTLLFLLHPMQVETVAWASELKGLLASLLSLAALCLVLAGADRPDRAKWYRLASYLSLFLALLAKPSAGAAPLLILAVEALCLGRSWPRACLAALPPLLAVIPLAVLTHSVQSHVPDFHAAPFYLRPFIAGDTLAFYLRKLVQPLPLVIDYGRTPALVLADAWGYMAWLIPVGLLLAAWRVRGLAWLRAPLAVFFLALLPVSGLVPFEFQYLSTVSDRYVYLAMLGPALALALGVRRIPSGLERPLFALVLALLVALGLVGGRQVRFWQDDLALNKHAIMANPGSFLARCNLGLALAAAGRTEEAAAEYREALRLNPAYPVARANLGNILIRLGRLEEAEAVFREALDRGREYPETLLGLGAVLAREGRCDEAMELFRRAIGLNPLSAQPHFNLGNCLALQGRQEEAAAEYKAFARLVQPDPTAYLQVGQALARVAHVEEAARCYGQALRLRPDFPEARARLEALPRGQAPGRQL